ncbi:hypothetical protein A2382_02020 [Candidatus Woesebacteria bacterium RIFOXYB1_FULL_38_16]|uniref:ATP synthase F1 complex delta/epsilon subunit N-terminal domain-containing protein n=1 Tax=Candidatus Woesebacteria bacterium RIFOXYB1_FULL_38_16 TaxID=1802538 RepID=A0A1F8CVV4_9BACT|nr:MAG: hypothetical protein A2191_04870 [Candidatus Woesebacteria bacterium RIFOXYA1_FULL_38_9]OGM79675.1 MAG: hypothetical protein A2382_02020 [Candidatus Woesebacteria bacterium RIFOXYB1_FULL_38_16]
MDQNLFVTIKDRSGRIFEGNAASVTSFNQKGKFDILPTHSNFITLIEKDIIIQNKQGETKTFKIENGVLRVVRDVVDIFLGIKK